MTKFRLNAGKYKHIVMFQKLDEEQDSYGETTQVWTDSFKARVGIYPLSGKEFFASKTWANETSHKVLLRYREDIDSDMRFIFNGRIFNIVSPPINFQESNQELQLICREVLS